MPPKHKRRKKEIRVAVPQTAKEREEGVEEGQTFDDEKGTKTHGSRSPILPQFSIEGDRMTIVVVPSSTFAAGELEDTLQSTTHMIRRLRFVPPPQPLPVKAELATSLSVVDASDRAPPSNADKEQERRNENGAVVSITPELITSISVPQLQSCVEEVIVQEGITDIQGHAWHCGFCCQFTSLKIARLPTSLKAVGVAFLRGCTKLTTIELPQGLTSVGGWALKGCRSLASISLPDTLTNVGLEFLCECTSLTCLHLPSSLTHVELGFLARCASLLSVRLPSSLTNVSSWFLFGCSSLCFVDLPDALTSAGDHFLGKCDALQEVHVRPKRWLTLSNSDSSVPTRIE